ncbi:multidrug effflux MFS transporter [Actibacterium pelagium]|uniref:Bcr/CflA family efflux transporter n=1 Tax=Actibacterium pelagium TaxID=2029103 RepID=A0A917AFS1_9RHOB|nr:multidrug effflux MFS transporter [Actibacterium pelagium]GGE49433.1 Bcr/CflA family drug resistance efflux transporter [Actibacterium pelagium]
MSTIVRSRFLDRTTPPHTLTLVLVAGLPALSMNMFLPSLPNMAEFYQSEYRVAQLSVSLYLWANAVLQIFLGPLSDRFGRRIILLISFALFGLASIGCALSTSIEMLLFFRTTQAVVATGIALSRAAVRDLYGREESASMIGYVTMGMSLAPMLSPMLGGFLGQHFGWQANFWAMLGFGVLVWVIIWLDFKETAQPSENSVIGQFREYPELLRSRRFWGYALAAAFSSGAFFAYVGGAPLVGAKVYGLEPAELGAYFGIPAAGYLVGNFLSGRYSIRLGINTMIITGSLLVVSGLSISLLLIALGSTHPLAFFGLTSFIGLGNGMVLPNANAGLLSVRPHLAGSASGLGGALMIGGGAALAALSGHLLEIGDGVLPLMAVMIGASVFGVFATLYVVRIDRLEGPVDPKHPPSTPHA